MSIHPKTYVRDIAAIESDSARDELWTEKQVAAYLSCSTKVLRAWRVSGSPIPYIVVGTRMIRYRRSAVEAYLRGAQRVSTSGAEGGNV